ncbi:D-glucuronyl C5-epimerase family protein [bacterium]|nr:D-glucuronyl C5-epimerase family protein [bacterium]
MNKDEITSYLVDYSKTKIPHTSGIVNKDGIPLFNLKNIRLEEEMVFHPTAIIQYGLAHYELFLRGDKDAFEVFVKCANWIKNNSKSDSNGNFHTWYINFPLRYPAKNPPSLSGMVQGQSISILIRLMKHQPEDSLEALLKSAIKGFSYSIDQGGIVTRQKDGSLFIEELAYDPAIHILNGSLYALYGIYEYNVFFNDSTSDQLLNRCMDGITNALDGFDTGYWSRYSLRSRWNLADTYYHNVHIKQLAKLGELLNNEKFLEYSKLWKSYTENNYILNRYKLDYFIKSNILRAMTVLKLNRFKILDELPHWKS